VVESLHQVHVVVSTANHEIVAHHGDPDWVTVYRSAAKPFQALPLMEDGGVETFSLSDDEVALTAASHNAEKPHLRAVRSILRKVGEAEEALRLGPSPPLRPATAEALYRDGGRVSPLHNNCSGQHAAMLGLVKIHGWELETYLDPDHPLQELMIDVMADYTGVEKERMALVPDGCGMVAFGVPLKNMARSFALLGTRSGSEPGPRRILGAMAAHPFMVAGTGRICTALGEVTGGRIIGKLGAEGVYGMVVPQEGLGIALKVQDGGIRAGDAAAIRALDLLGLLEPEEAQALEGFRRGPLFNTLGEEVGAVYADYSFESAGAL
jgi:L-asparaginase II